MRKYHHPSGSRQWVFFGEVERKGGVLKKIELFRASTVPIRRHTKIKSEANPYDPDWEPYMCAVSSAIRRATNVAKSLGIFCTHRA
jgi:RNA-directed DNA polymerase